MHQLLGVIRQRYPNATNAQAGTFRGTEKGNGHTRIGAAAPAIPPSREARQLPKTRAYGCYKFLLPAKMAFASGAGVPA